MRRLLVLTAATVLLASSGGCFHWFNRGAYNAGYPAAASCGDPCATSAGPAVSEGYLPGPTP